MCVGVCVCVRVWERGRQEKREKLKRDKREERRHEKVEERRQDAETDRQQEMDMKEEVSVLIINFNFNKPTQLSFKEKTLHQNSSSLKEG